MYTDDMMNARMRMGSDGTADRPACGITPPTCGCDDGCTHTTEAYGYACGHTWGLDGYPPGMVFAPIQRFDRIFDLETALKKGTVFEELDLPFVCGDAKKGGCCNG